MRSVSEQRSLLMFPSPQLVCVPTLMRQFDGTKQQIIDTDMNPNKESFLCDRNIETVVCLLTFWQNLSRSSLQEK